MGRVSRGIGYPTITGPSTSTRLVRKTGEIPSLLERGEIYTGKFGPLIRRERGDYPPINDSLARIKEEVVTRRTNLVEHAERAEA